MCDAGKFVFVGDGQHGEESRNSLTGWVGLCLSEERTGWDNTNANSKTRQTVTLRETLLTLVTA